MVTSTPDTTRQLVADRHSSLAAARGRPRRLPSPRSPSPRRRSPWWVVGRLHAGRT